MDILIWIGAAVSLAGLVGILWCIRRVAQARKQNLSDEALRQTIRTVMPINLGALFLSVLGLMMVVVGIFLG